MNPILKNTIESISTSKRELLVQIIIVFIVSISFVASSLIPIGSHVLFLIIVAILFIALLMKERWTLSMLGFHKSSVIRYLLPYIIFTVCGAILISQFGQGIGREEVVHWWQHKHFLYTFFVVSAFQEIAYRGYLIPALGKLTTSPALILICNTLLFTYLHIIFPDLYITIPMALIGGIGFALMYMRYPNMQLIILSHAVLNFVAVLYGFFAIPGVTY